MLRRFISLLALAVSTVGVGQVASAAEETIVGKAERPEAVSSPATAGEAIYVGGMIGYALPNGGTNGKETTGRLGWGFDAGYKFVPEFGLGAYLMSNSGSAIDAQGKSIADTSYGVTSYGVEPTYYGPYGLYIGGRVGLSSKSASKGKTLDVSSTAFSFGPRLGVDFELVRGLTLGVDASYLWVNSSEAELEVNGIKSKVELDGIQVFSTVATVKYHFSVL